MPAKRVNGERMEALHRNGVLKKMLRKELPRKNNGRI
jgi:hypothetical protein